MKRILPAVLLLLFPAALFSQQLPTWYRIYTFDDSVIEMNTAVVTFISQDTSRVRFRWTFDQPQALPGEPRLKYQSRLEVIEFNCSLKRYRPYHLTFFDAAGNMIGAEKVNSPNEWRTPGSMTEKLMAPACALVKQKLNPPPVVSSDKVELEKAARFAVSFVERLEQTKDFKPLIKQFFAADYLGGYLHDQDTNWFANLNRETAAKASRAELQKFHVALLNGAYWSCTYLVSQYPRVRDGSTSEEKLIPPDIIELIATHPYTASNKRGSGTYDYLAEQIDSVERLRSYTDLLEGIGALLRRHAISERAAQSSEYQALLADWDLYEPQVKICSTNCLNLPKGTRLIEVNVPAFRLQLAEIEGMLKVVSARDYFH